MVSCPVFLRQKGLLFKKEGATLTEILISATVIALLAVLLLYAFQPQTQVTRSQDAKRKADLSKLTNILEDYYNDHNCYPTTLNDLVPDYINPLPRDPETGELYEYYPDGCQIYRVYVVLGYTEDPDIIEAGCEYGCGPLCDFNYGVCSSNAQLECCGPGPTPTPCEKQWACQQGYCKIVDPALCEPRYCSSDCDLQCKNDPGSVGDEIGCP